MSLLNVLAGKMVQNTGGGRDSADHSRTAFTIIELIVVIGLIGLLVSFLVPAIQQVRSVANKMSCSSHLRQLGIAAHNFHDLNLALPRVRLCPDLVNDPFCISVTDPRQYTGPRETWWAPYDNRVGPADAPLPDFDPSKALIWPFVEENLKLFCCPDAIQVAPSTAYRAKPLQTSYGMNYVSDGPSGQSLIRLGSTQGTSNILFIWDHANLPGCAAVGPGTLNRVPWPPSNSFSFFALPCPSRRKTECPVL